MKDARRRLLAAVAVDYEIAVTDVTAAVKMQVSIKVWRRCRLALSKPVLKAPMGSVLATTMC